MRAWARRSLGLSIICSASALVGACGGSGGSMDMFLPPAPPPGVGPNPLSYVTWGPWSRGGDVGAAPIGYYSVPSDIPSTGTARFNGGAYATNGASGSATIDIDFAKSSVSVGITLPNTGAGSVTANGTGSLTTVFYEAKGSQTASFDVPVVPYSYDFAAKGALYGPGAAETAGTFTLSTEHPLMSLKQSFEGTFGAKK